MLSCSQSDAESAASSIHALLQLVSAEAAVHAGEASRGAQAARRAAVGTSPAISAALNLGCMQGWPAEAKLCAGQMSASSIHALLQLVRR